MLLIISYHDRVSTYATIKNIKNCKQKIRKTLAKKVFFMYNKEGA